MNDKTFSFDDPSGDVGRSSDEIIDGRPPPTESPIVETTATSVSSSVPVDSNNVPFDASLHAVGADGKPVKTARGTWRKKRGTGERSKLNDPRRVEEQKRDENAPRVLTPDEIARAKATGAMIAENVITIAKVVGGPDFEPRREPIDDRAMLSEAWQNYCVAQGVVELPPGMFLVAAHLAYIAPRFTMPETQSRVTSLKVKIASWWIKRRDAAKRRKGEEPNTADQSTERALS